MGLSHNKTIPNDLLRISTMQTKQYVLVVFSNYDTIFTALVRETKHFFHFYLKISIIIKITNLPPNQKQQNKINFQIFSCHIMKSTRNTM